MGGSVCLVPGVTRRRPQATRLADAAGSAAAWAWEGWGRVDVREGRSGEAMGGGKERVRWVRVKGREMTDMGRGF